LNRIGFQVSPDEVFSSLSAARRVVESRKLRPLLLLQKEALEDFDGICLEYPNAVLVGLAPQLFSYEVLNEAFRLLMKGCPLIAVHKARYYKKSDGLALGPGPFIEALEYASGRAANIVGKPEKSFFQSALDRLGVSADETVMIGDDVRDDVLAAMRLGMTGILVKTGKYRSGDEELLPSDGQCHVVDTFADAVQCIETSLR
jgi:HAD superfamily hydrolase (TIGR01458 family)